MRILHLFNYKVKDIDMEKVKRQGFDAIQIGPIQPLKQDGEVPWFLLYQPISFRIGNFYCNKEELMSLCEEGERKNVKVIVDVVLNHVAGINSGLSLPHEKVSIRNIKYYKKPIQINNWNDRNEVINYCMGLPKLDLNNHELQDKIIVFLNKLIDCGVGGFRFDSGKHIGLPREGNSFWIRVLENLKRKDLFNYAEVIFTEREVLREYTKYIKVLTENREIKSENIISFVESHDSFLEFGYTKEISDESIIKKYEILCNRYENTLFYARPFNNTWEDGNIRKINLQYKKVRAL